MPLEPEVRGRAQRARRAAQHRRRQRQHRRAARSRTRARPNAANRRRRGGRCPPRCAGSRAELMEPVARTNIGLGELIPASLYVRDQLVRPRLASALDAALARFDGAPADSAVRGVSRRRNDCHVRRGPWGLARHHPLHGAGQSHRPPGHLGSDWTNGRRMPVDVQLVRHRHAETRLLRVAAACEDLAGFSARRSPLSPLARKG